MPLRSSLPENCAIIPVSANKIPCRASNNGFHIPVAIESAAKSVGLTWPAIIVSTTDIKISVTCAKKTGKARESKRLASQLQKVIKKAIK